MQRHKQKQQQQKKGPGTGGEQNHQESNQPNVIDTDQLPFNDTMYYRWEISIFVINQFRCQKQTQPLQDL